GAIAFSVDEFEGAYDYLSRLAPYVTSLSTKDAVDSLMRYAQAASRVGSPAAVLTAAQKLAELVPNELDVQRQMADLVFNHGQTSDAEQLYKNLLDRFGTRLPATDRSELSTRYAECVARSGQLDLAVSLLEEAADLDPKATKPLEVLAAAYLEKNEYSEAWEV